MADRSFVTAAQLSRSLPGRSNPPGPRAFGRGHQPLAVRGTSKGRTVRADVEKPPPRLWVPKAERRAIGRQAAGQPASVGCKIQSAVAVTVADLSKPFPCGPVPETDFAG